MNETTKLHGPISVYVTAVIFLDVAHKIGKNSVNKEELLNDLQTTIDHCHRSSQFNNYSMEKITSMVCEYRKSATTDRLIELLQQSAIELLTTFRRAEVREVGSLTAIVTTDFKALYAYKRGDYMLCLQLSKENVRVLLQGFHRLSVFAFPEFIQLLDDDIVSLLGLTAIEFCRLRPENGGRMYTSISQLTLSLYLTAQCQTKLRHSVQSAFETLYDIKLAKPRHPIIHETLNELMLKLTARKLFMYISAEI